MRKIDRIKLLLVMGIVIIGPILLRVVAYLSHGKTTCMYEAIGLGCLGCNGLAAIHELIQGRILESFRTNPCVLLGGGLGAILITNELYIQLRRYLDTQYTNESWVDCLIKKMFKGMDF